jgi:hypothetical protein
MNPRTTDPQFGATYTLKQVGHANITFMMRATGLVEIQDGDAHPKVFDKEEARNLWNKYIQTFGYNHERT